MRDAIKTFMHNGLTVKIHHDTDPVNPIKDYDVLSTLLCWHRRYDLGHERIEQMTAKEVIRRYRNVGEKVLAILPLYLYDHSGITMNTTGFSCGWDSGQVGWAVVTRTSAEAMGCVGVHHNHVRNADGTHTAVEDGTWDKARLEEGIRQDVESYDHYLTGECYGYVIEGRDGDELASCWGFLGDMESNCVEEAKSATIGLEDPAVVADREELAGRATFAGVSP